MASRSEEGASLQGDEYETLFTTTDAELLKRAWRHEKAAPDILPFQSPLVQRLREQIQLMDDTVEEFAESGVNPLTVSLYQMDLDRTLFLLRSYLRVRLLKIEKYMISAAETDIQNRLSEQELKFAKRCTDEMEKHLERSALSELPEFYRSIRKQSTASEENDMVPEPPADAFVFCKSKGTWGAIQLDEREDPLELVVDDLYILRYQSIKPLVESGQVDLV